MSRGRKAGVALAQASPALVDLAQARTGRVLSAERAAPTCLLETPPLS